MVEYRTKEDRAFLDSVPSVLVALEVLEKENPRCYTSVLTVDEPGWTTFTWTCHIHRVTNKTAVRHRDNLTYSSLPDMVVRYLQAGRNPNPCDGYTHPVKFLSLTPRILPPQGTQF